jgi:hypothetical protein
MDPSSDLLWILILYPRPLDPIHFQNTDPDPETTHKIQGRILFQVLQLHNTFYYKKR